LVGVHSRSLPIIDIAGAGAATAIDAACREVGFFAIENYDVDQSLRGELIAAASEFFGLPPSAKRTVSLARGGLAWRGWFALGDELTAGIPDLKEGYYFGTDRPTDGRPLHGRNIWPERPAALAALVTEWMAAMLTLGQRVLELMATGLGLSASFFADGLTKAPTELFRIFRYPPHPAAGETRWGVAEHSDYGLLTLLAHDGTAGLEVKVGDDWLSAPADPSLIICNIGDMLDRLTSGRYRSTPHRVRNQALHDRYSLPYFLDPGWDAVVEPLSIEDGFAGSPDAQARWDKTDLQQISGTYGDWLWGKVSKVFPELATSVVIDPTSS
jgi:isopenicillin N synthase-like dioxygenase